MQQVSYLEGGPLMWMLPLYQNVNQKSDDDDDDDDEKETLEGLNYFAHAKPQGLSSVVIDL